MKTLGIVIGFGLIALPWIAMAESPTCRVTPQFSSQGSVGKALSDAIRGAHERLTVALYGLDNTDMVMSCSIW